MATPSRRLLEELRAATLESPLDELGVLRSFSSPRVSNDNPYSESAIREQGGGLPLGGLISGLLQPPAPPQRDQVRDSPPAPLGRCRGHVPSPRCCLQGGTSAEPAPLVTISALLASTGSGLDQPTTSRNRTQFSYIENGCLNSSRGVIFPGSHRAGKTTPSRPGRRLF